MDAWIALLSAGSAAVGVVMAKGLDWVRAWSDTAVAQKKAEAEADLARRRQEADSDKSETEQALAVYREVVTGLRSDMKELVEHLRKQDETLAEYRVQNALLTAQVRELQERVEELEARLGEAK